jgi:translation elongation factor EF-G
VFACVGAVIGGLNQRRGTIIDSEVRDDEFVCTAEVALNDMFGYSNHLRGSTQGKGEFSMEYKVKNMFSDLSVFSNHQRFLKRTTCLFCLNCKKNWKILIANWMPQREGSFQVM